MLPIILALLFLAGCGIRPDLPPLAAAARSGRTDLIATLVKQGADPDAPAGGNGWTPLMHAIHKNQKHSVIALLDAGAGVDARGTDGMTPLMMAAGYGYTDIVNVLLDRGADARIRLSDGENALSLAVLGMPDIDRFTVADCQAGTVQTLVRRVPGLRFIGPPGILRGITIAKVKACPGLAELMAARNP
ncbi:MAG TPA: ankyrin repeat domain-containing protein [Bryobacteraceae bacterium]|nr:ankyrin repeat domain-containing protein [Bryobacteraceae bacterium]